MVLTLIRDMFGEVVEVRVGEAPSLVKSFYLHKAVLAFYSGYFEAAFKDTFSEGKTGVLELATETVEVFEHFVLWLYTRQMLEISDQNLSLTCFSPRGMHADKGSRLPFDRPYSCGFLRTVDTFRYLQTVPSTA